MGKQSEINNLIFKAFELVNLDKYQEAQDIIHSILNNKLHLNELKSNHWQYIGDIYLSCSRFDNALSSFINANNIPAQIFTLIILGKLKEAIYTLKTAQKSSLTAWCEFLIDLFYECNFVRWPTFLLIRQYLEITVYYLLLAKNHNHLQFLLKNLNKLLEVNLDSEKYVGYAYCNYGDLEKAVDFLKNSIKRNPLEGESQYMLAKVYFMQNKYVEALNTIRNAEILLPKHYPTQMLIERLEGLLAPGKNT